MQTTRRALVLSIAASAALAACGGSGADAGSGNGHGLSSSDSASIASFSPASVPATSALPITFSIDFTVDLETIDSAVVVAAYQVAPNLIVTTSSTQTVVKGPASGTLFFSLPASALTSTDLGVVVQLVDPSTGTVLSQDVALVARSG